MVREHPPHDGCRRRGCGARVHHVQLGRQEGRERDASERERVPPRALDSRAGDAGKDRRGVCGDRDGADELDAGVDAEEFGEARELGNRRVVPVARARALNEQMRKSGTDILPDGFVRFMAVSDEAVTVRKVWRRPIAIGVKGVTLEVDKYTGDVLRMGYMGSPLRKR